MSRSDDDDDQSIVLDVIDDAVGTHANALVDVAAGMQFAMAGREGILLQTYDGSVDSSADVFRQAINFFLCPWRQEDGVGHF